jgi:hypothetical protein
MKRAVSFAGLPSRESSDLAIAKYIKLYHTAYHFNDIVLYQSSSLHTKLYQTISKYIIYKLSIPKYIISRCVFFWRWRPSDGCSPPWLPIRSSSMTLCRATETDKTWGQSRHSWGFKRKNGVWKMIPIYSYIEYCFYDDSYWFLSNIMMIPINDSYWLGSNDKWR